MTYHLTCSSPTTQRNRLLKVAEQKTIEQLQAENLELSNKLEASNKANEGLTEENKVLSAKVEKAIANVTELTKSNEDLEKLVKSLSEKVKEQEASLPKVNSCKLKGVEGVEDGTYIILGGCRTKDGIFTAEQLAENPELVAELVKMGSELVKLK